MAFFKHRPKARFKLGQAVRGETFGGRAQGYVIYSEYDKADRRHGRTGNLTHRPPR